MTACPIPLFNLFAYDRAVDPDPDTDPIWIQGLMTKNWRKKNTDLIKNCNLLMSKLQEKPSALKREHPALQKMKVINFFYVCG